MTLLHLGVQNVRNLKETNIYPSAAVNFLIGNNGSGKTSVLESIFLLGRARSFRTSRLSNITRQGFQYFAVSGKLAQLEAPPVVLRIAHESRTSTLSADDRILRKASDLASYLPLIYIDSTSYRLLSEGPNQRRNFLDWGLFHVEPRFLPVWKRYNRVLRQRNASLRDWRRLDPGLWDSELIESGEEIDRMRGLYVQELAPILAHYTRILFNQGDSRIGYWRGWDPNQTYTESLADSRIYDQSSGFTRRGPHRADLEVYSDDRLLVDTYSRGQQKLFLCALHIAQIDLFRRRTGKPTVVLIDDLSSELDPDNRNHLVKLLTEMGTQIFITTTEESLVDESQIADKAVFHVKHGAVCSTTTNPHLVSAG